MTTANEALLRVSRGTPGRLPIYNTILYTNRFINNLWGSARVTGISGQSSGSALLTFTDLTGITISSYGSTGPVPVKVGNTITFPSGSFWDIRLSDGTYIPDPTSGLNVSDTGAHAISSGFTIDITSGGTMYFYLYGYNRSGLTMRPAKFSDVSEDVYGSPILYPAVIQGLNMADGIIDYSAISDNDIFNKLAIEGNGLGLQQIWSFGTVWDYNGNEFHWLPEERGMSYLYSRFADSFKKIIFTTEVLDGPTMRGLVREEVFQFQLSDSDALFLNTINNGTALP